MQAGEAHPDTGGIHNDSPLVMYARCFSPGLSSTYSEDCDNRRKEDDERHDTADRRHDVRQQDLGEPAQVVHVHHGEEVCQCTALSAE